MVYKVHFKYSIDDEVTLIKSPNYGNNQYGYCSYTDGFVPSKYKIDGYKYVIHEDGTEEVFYRLYAYMDKYVNYHNWFEDDFLEGDGTEHDEDIEFISVDGKEVRPGDTVYSSIYYGGFEDTYISPQFTFSKKIYVTDLSYFGTSHDTFFAHVIGNEVYPRQDFTNKYSGFLHLCVKNIDKKFVEDYVKGCKENRYNPTKNNNDRCKEWLDYLGIYDDVCKLYKKRSKQKKNKNDGEMKVLNIVSELTDKEKEEMLKILLTDRSSE